MQDSINEILEKHSTAAANIKDVGAEINIIAINAAIESAHTASGVRTMMDSILDELMNSVC